MEKKINVCIAGAGGISSSHISILKSLPGINVRAVVDPQIEMAESLAKAWNVEAFYADPTELFAKKLCDVAHILVPPHKHTEVALPYINAGMHVLIEKPMCLSVAEATLLKEAAQRQGVLIGVNQNTTFTLAHQRVKEIIRSNTLGKIHHIYYHWNTDLPLLAGKKYTHWLFQSPPNIFFEQAVHPLAQIYDLIGAMRDCSVLTRNPIKLAAGIDFFDTWQISMVCEQATAQFFYSIGQEFPGVGMSIICENGTITANLMRNRVVVETNTPGRDFVDYHTGQAITRQVRAQGVRGFYEELKATFRLRPPTDWQSEGMRNSIAGFYNGLQHKKLPVDVDFGTEVVRMCERIVEKLPAVSSVATTKTPASKLEPADVAIFGGTGFIGRHIVQRLVEAGMRVNVMARGNRGLPEIFSHELVQCYPGNIANPADVEQAIGAAPYVIDLAFSFGDSSWDYMEKVNIKGCQNVAEACLRKNVKRLIYTSTIGVLDLASANNVIKDSTGPDPKFETGDIYSKFKSICENLLLEMHRKQGLQVCIFRPGLVIGEDGNPYHSGVAKFYNKQHATCFGAGSHPLPFVLVKDTAEAYYQALTKPDIDGKSYNLVGDVRLSAREYVTELATILKRPITFVSIPGWKMKLSSIPRWLLKMSIGRVEPLPDFHAMNCTGLYGSFDNQEVKRDLGWQPVSEREKFILEGMKCYQKTS